MLRSDNHDNNDTDKTSHEYFLRKLGVIQPNDSSEAIYNIVQSFATILETKCLNKQSSPEYIKNSVLAYTILKKYNLISEGRSRFFEDLKTAADLFSLDIISNRSSESFLQLALIAFEKLTQSKQITDQTNPELKKHLIRKYIYLRQLKLIDENTSEIHQIALDRESLIRAHLQRVYEAQVTLCDESSPCNSPRHDSLLSGAVSLSAAPKYPQETKKAENPVEEIKHAYNVLMAEFGDILEPVDRVQLEIKICSQIKTELTQKLEAVTKSHAFKESIEEKTQTIARLETQQGLNVVEHQAELEEAEGDYELKAMPVIREIQVAAFKELYSKNIHFFDNFVKQHQNKHAIDFIAEIQKALASSSDVRDNWTKAQTEWKTKPTEFKTISELLAKLQRIEAAHVQSIQQIKTIFREKEQQLASKIETLNIEKKAVELQMSKLTLDDTHLDPEKIKRQLAIAESHLTFKENLLRSFTKKDHKNESSEAKVFSPKVSSTLVSAFKKIYMGLRNGQCNWFKTNFLSETNTLNDQELLLRIQTHAKSNPTSRTAKAWELTQQHHDNCTPDNLALFLDMYKYAFSETGFFKKSAITGTTFFKSSSFNNQVNHFTQHEFDYAKAHPGSRGDKILQALEEDHTLGAELVIRR